ncbi:hypothetical protein CORC01_10275 [Colletotrichum orchidophilum]|uniref:Uncharacterized protein n=1 Tax=Colletotrichum orchidophilum TaxID=1209926 RepID=A0A1G4AZA6_9PEZI|nr:uncharacterized protein CORC01_10275 [Colletotrichum orchidophilum]OHE94456.1 hypothetical protein CORC01_10275 [Colletotrichum orchidophilum]
MLLQARCQGIREAQPHCQSRLGGSSDSSYHNYSNPWASCFSVSGSQGHQL